MQRAVSEILSVATKRLALIESAKILALIKSVELMLSALPGCINLLVNALKAIWEIHMTFANSQSAWGTLIARTHWHAGIRSVWILVTVLRMRFVMQETTEVFAPACPASLETPILEDAIPVRIFLVPRNVSNFHPFFFVQFPALSLKTTPVNRMQIVPVSKLALMEIVRIPA